MMSVSMLYFQVTNTSTASANALYHRILEFDISNENEMDLYELFNPKGLVIILELHTILKKRQYGRYTTNNGRIQSYTISSTGDFESGDSFFKFQTSSSSIWQCGISNQQARGLK